MGRAEEDAIVREERAGLSMSLRDCAQRRSGAELDLVIGAALVSLQHLWTAT